MSNKNLGTLFVRLNAESKKFVKDMATASEAVEKFAKETKKLANDVAQFAGTLVAVGGAAVAMAAQVDRRASGSVLRLTEAMQSLAIQVSDLLEPAVRALTSTFRTLAQYVAGLDPEVKKQISTWAVYAVQLAVAAKALGAVANLADAAFGALGYGLKLIASVGLAPILGIVAALAAVAAIVIFVHRAWRKNWGDIQGITEQVFNALGDAVKWLSDLFASMWNSIIDGAEKMVNGLLFVVEKVASLTGQSVDLGGTREGMAGLFKDLRSGEFVKNALTLAKQVATDTKDVVIEEVKLIAKEVSEALNLDGLVQKGKPRGKQVMNADEERAFAESLDEWFRSMDAERRAKQREQRDLFDASLKSYRDEKKARAELAAKIAFDAKMERAGRTGDMSGLSKGEQALVSKDPGGAWSELNKAQQNVKNLAKRLGGLVANSFGALSSTISSIAQGAQAGGVWGAMLMAVMEIFNRMESFKRLLSFFEQGLVRLGEFLEPLVGKLFEFVAEATALGTEILSPIFKALGPLFESIVKLARKAFEPLAILGNVFSAIGPVLELLFSGIGKMFEMLTPLLDFAVIPLKLFASALLGFLILINEIAAALGDQKARAEADRLGKMVESMWAPGAGDRANADAAAAAAAWDVSIANKAAADSARDVAEQLSNVPSGYKVALARFNATSPGEYEAAMGAIPGLSGAGGAPVFGADAQDSGSTVIVNGDMNVNASDTQALTEEIERERRRKRAARSGNPTDPYDP